MENEEFSSFFLSVEQINLKKKRIENQAKNYYQVENEHDEMKLMYTNEFKTKKMGLKWRAVARRECETKCENTEKKDSKHPSECCH